MMGSIFKEEGLSLNKMGLTADGDDAVDAEDDDENLSLAKYER